MRTGERRGKPRLPAVEPQDPEPHPSPSVRVWAFYVESGASPNWQAQFLSALNAELDHLAGKRSTSRFHGLPAEIPEEIRAAFAPGRDPIDDILGYFGSFDRFGNGQDWRPGLAGLEPQEREAYRLHLRRFTGREIQRHMSRMSSAARRKRTESLFPGYNFVELEPEDLIPLETVNQLVWRARDKCEALRAQLSAAGAPGGDSSSTSQTSSQTPTHSPDASAPLTRTPRISYKTPGSVSSRRAASASLTPCGRP